jgi:Mn-containing catalase
MNNTKVCQQCQQPFIPKRSDAVFCGDTCRWNNWREKNAAKVAAKQPPAEVKQENNLSQTLRGVAGDEPVKKSVFSPFFEPEKKEEQPDFILKEIQAETETYKKAKAKLDEQHTFVKRVTDAINACNEQLKWLQNGSMNLLPITTTAAAGYIGNKQSKGDSMTTILSGLVGYGLGKLVDATLFEEDREKQKQKNIALLNERERVLQNQLNEATKTLEQATTSLNGISRYETKQVKQPILRGTNVWGKSLFLPKSQVNNIENKILNDEKHSVIQTNDKVISSKELKTMDYKSLNFQNRWKDFFGLPAVVFSLAVHGKPGEGKSTFCIQFAQYLAENFGMVVFISGEEGFSKTLRDKVVNNKADSSFLFFADYKNYDEIKAKLENKFHFIFLDSLDTLKIDTMRLRELRELFPNSAFITISQSTKDGKMRGSNEIVHDADIAVKVENGIAITTKNRFKERDMQFKVFLSNLH